MNKKESFLKNRMKSFAYAFKGLLFLLKNETSFQIQAVIAILISIAGLYFEISSNEWILQTLSITLLMCAEGFNTAIEKLADFIHSAHHPKIGTIKDIAAAAVIIMAIAAVIVAGFIYIPKL